MIVAPHGGPVLPFFEVLLPRVPDPFIYLPRGVTESDIHKVR